MSSILIIGGGVIGLSLARELHKQNSGKITVLEKGLVGREASFAAAGILAPQAEADKTDDFFRFCLESKELFPSLSEELLEETGIDIELDRKGVLYAAFDDADVREIRERCEWQKKAGLEIEQLQRREAQKAEPFISPDLREALFFPNDWQVKNRRLLRALQKYAEINGIEIIENAEVKDLLFENERSIGAEISGERYFAETVVIAAGAWSSLIGVKGVFCSMPAVKPIRGQMISFHTAKRLFQRVIYSPRGYLVPRKDGKILVGATVEDAGFVDEVTEKGVSRLEENAYEISPGLINIKIDETWSGLRPFATDGLPVIGAVSDTENLFVATAHYRNGILLAPMTAKILADRIVNRNDSEYFRVFSADRFKTALAK